MNINIDTPCCRVISCGVSATNHNSVVVPIPTVFARLTNLQGKQLGVVGPVLGPGLTTAATIPLGHSVYGFASAEISTSPNGQPASPAGLFGCSPSQ